MEKVIYKKRFIESSKIEDYIIKFSMKMRGSSFDEAIDWLEGISTISNIERKQIFHAIEEYIDKTRRRKGNIPFWLK